MSYTALYRKWRPATFDDVKGQDHIVQTLKNQILSNRIGHAYLFCGTRGTGKTTIAKIFARAVNCEDSKDGSPCNQCEVCRTISSGSSLNVVEIDAASNNGVDNIREIREQVEYPPTDGRFRVYIIDEVHMLSTGAFNALLKTLEEPPSYVIFILATTEAHKIPITVLSRCQRYDFKRITIETIAARLHEMTETEGVQTEDKALRYLAKAGDGSMRDAISLLDQCIAFHYGEVLSYDNVLDVLGAVDTSVFSSLLRAVIDGDTTSCIYKLEEMVVQGRELGQFVTDFIWYMRNLLLVQTAQDAEDMLDISADNLAALKEEADMIKTEVLMRYIRVFSELSNQIRYAGQKRIMIELALIRLTKPEMEHNMDSVLERISRLENQIEEGIPMTPIAPVYSGDGMTAYAPAAQPLNPEAPWTKEVTIPKAQLEDLQLVRNEWGKIVREIGRTVRTCFRDTVVEPSGDSCLCIVFSDDMNYTIGSRASVIGDLERYVEQTYGKSIYFKTRVKDTGETFNNIYVTVEDLKENIHMDIIIED